MILTMAAMQLCMAARAQRDQIRFLIRPLLAAQLLVMNLQIIS